MLLYNTTYAAILACNSWHDCIFISILQLTCTQCTWLSTLSCHVCNRQEYATIAGMIVTQYGRPVPLPVPSGELDDRGSHVSSALDQLRGYYGLGSASPSGPGPDYFRGLHLSQMCLQDLVDLCCNHGCCLPSTLE